MNFCDLFPSYGTQDINVAEPMGGKAIEIVISKGVRKIKIFPDSQAAIDVIESLQINRKRGMKKKVCKMCPNILYNIRWYSETVDVKLMKVKSKSQGNAGANKLCDEALKNIGCEKKNRKKKKCIAGTIDFNKKYQATDFNCLYIKFQQNYDVSDLKKFI